jgi:hypothetical protein
MGVPSLEDGFLIWLLHFRSAAASRIELGFRRGLSHFNFATAALILTTVTLAYVHGHGRPLVVHTRFCTPIQQQHLC